MNDSSIGIIGGSDGPTAIFVSGSPMAAVAAIAVVAAIIVLVVIIRKKKNKK